MFSRPKLDQNLTQKQFLCLTISQLGYNDIAVPDVNEVSEIIHFALNIIVNNLK